MTSSKFTPGSAYQKVRVQTHLHPWRAFLLAVLLYIPLSFREISAWGKPLWMLLAFGIIPGLCALAMGKTDDTGRRVRASLWAIGLAMALYTAVNLMRVHARIGSSEGASAVFLVGLVVTVVYALLAGGVGALLGIAWDHVGAKDK